MRKSNDPALGMIANRLMSVTLEPEHSQSELDDYHALRGRKGWRNVTSRLAFGRKTLYTVRLFLGGAVRSIGFTHNLDVALRFSDMATIYFWKYRERGGRGEPEGKHFNITKANAEADMADRPDVVSILDEVEDHLLSNQVLSMDDLKKPDLNEAGRPKSQSRQLRDALAASDARFSAFLERYAALETRFNLLCRAVANPSDTTRSELAAELLGTARVNESDSSK